MHIYPILLRPRVFPLVWGGDRLQKIWAPDIDFPQPLGEIWGIHGNLSIVNGPYVGLKLDELWRRFPKEMSGRADIPSSFPILVKWLDTRDWLSLQVHPDDVQARLIEGRDDARGKVECWYVVYADERAELICGCHNEDDVKLIANLSGRDLLSHIYRQVVKPGDFLFLPAGTIHALGPGLTVLEVQQNSDITYRFYDWDRPHVKDLERSLHLEQARRSWLYSKRVEKHNGSLPKTSLGKLLTTNSFFAQELVSGVGPYRWKPDSVEVLISLDAQLKVSINGEYVTLNDGKFALIPASSPEVSVDIIGREAKFMRVIVNVES